MERKIIIDRMYLFMFQNIFHWKYKDIFYIQNIDNNSFIYVFKAFPA